MYVHWGRLAVCLIRKGQRHCWRLLVGTFLKMKITLYVACYQTPIRDMFQRRWRGKTISLYVIVTGKLNNVTLVIRIRREVVGKFERHTRLKEIRQVLKVYINVILIHRLVT